MPVCNVRVQPARTFLWRLISTMSVPWAEPNPPSLLSSISGQLCTTPRPPPPPRTAPSTPFPRAPHCPQTPTKETTSQPQRLQIAPNSGDPLGLPPCLPHRATVYHPPLSLTGTAFVLFGVSLLHLLQGRGAGERSTRRVISPSAATALPRPSALPPFCNRPDLSPNRFSNGQHPFLHHQPPSHSSAHPRPGPPGGNKTTAGAKHKVCMMRSSVKAKRPWEPIAQGVQSGSVLQPRIPFPVLILGGRHAPSVRQQHPRVARDWPKAQSPLNNTHSRHNQKSVRKRKI